MSVNTDILIIKTIAELIKWRKSVDGLVGFIPTMGYLHEGHVSLMNLAKEQNEYVVVSIFVNPKQFGPNEDFNTYPRDEKHDIFLLKEAHVDVLFLPEVEEMYPKNFETTVSVTNLSRKLEGKHRPGHFDGVATVVSKLINIVHPNRVYFGQKDAQQVLIMKKLVNDMQLPTTVVVGETVRQNNGLALSSRNTFLKEKEKIESTVIFRSLLLAQKLVTSGVRNSSEIKQAMYHLIEKTSGIIEYISIADPDSLDEIPVIQRKVLVSLAVYYGKTRLIDNCIITI